MVKFIAAEGRRVALKDSGRGDGSYCLIGTEFQFGKMKKFWREWW